MVDFNISNKLNALNKKQDNDATKDPKLTEETPLNKLDVLDIKKSNKEQEKKEAAEEAMRTRCKICFKETSPQRKCPGHGGGGGGGSDNGGELQNDDGPDPERSENTSIKDQVNTEELILDEGIEAGWGSSSLPEEEQLVFDLDRIMQLVLFNNDSGRGILTIRAKPGHLVDDEQEIQEFLKAIEAAFGRFKTDLEQQNIPVDNFTCILGKNELVIRIPVPKYFDAFIQDLIAQKLLPDENIKQNAPLHHATVIPTPFALTPSPSRTKKDDLEQNDVENGKRSSLSPFSTELKPIDH